ncbi:tRNA (guanosine(37)-N1)-methyltransferase TrmD [Brachyspira hyodysenteriae]|uniref:tRNA (guanosine(37)-N1)-methyltransferase TrmD n=1 Tax=Brachyspira hyodysenteriae TaxID=159 RepID=UPI001183F2C4|nr:tRNA (guanosine(37)-N1)-methyltransferase TrmD [Brachyspira hyodysenteriae]TVL76701.1 tRNA (guanosine(37)-N1)-methyltransferase TrmD [Brachyspira hyodysenteriae]
MIIDILTLFQKFYESTTSFGVISMALNEKKIDLNIEDMRVYGEGNYKKCDDYPYGGGPGMIMTFNIFKKYFDSHKKGYTIIFSPSGKTLTQQKIKELSDKEHITIILGHYEGIDYRVEEKYADEALSIGDYVLSGGEIPALLLLDAIARYKGVMNNEESVISDTFEENSNGLLEYEQYTRPPEIDNMKVPEILLSGNHKNINEYRRKRSIIKTFENRADLFSKINLSKKDIETIFEYLKENHNK